MTFDEAIDEMKAYPSPTRFILDYVDSWADLDREHVAKGLHWAMSRWSRENWEGKEINVLSLKDGRDDRKDTPFVFAVFAPAESEEKVTSEAQLLSLLNELPNP